MNFSRWLLLGCAAICGATLLPRRCCAQCTPATQPAMPQASADDALRPDYLCACGCDIFSVGTASMLPSGQGGMLYFEYDYQDQNINWSGVKPAPRPNNDDKNIRTNFFTLGAQYFFSRAWGIQVELPYDNRSFQTTGGATGSNVVTTQWGDFGDVRVQGIYTGFFDDQSLGISFGTKIPTGSWTHEDRFDDIDRDSQLGTGSWDILLGTFYRQHLTGNLTGFTQILLDAPVTQAAGYRPGVEADGSIGVYLTGLKLGPVSITPVGQVLISERGHDSGPAAASPVASGFTRVLLSPGLEFDVHPFTVYSDIELPVYQHYTGEQLTAPFLFKVIFSYHF